MYNEWNELIKVEESIADSSLSFISKYINSLYLKSAKLSDLNEEDIIRMTQLEEELEECYKKIDENKASRNINSESNENELQEKYNALLEEFNKKCTVEEKYTSQTREYEDENEEKDNRINELIDKSNNLQEKYNSINDKYIQLNEVTKMEMEENQNLLDRYNELLVRYNSLYPNEETYESKMQHQNKNKEEIKKYQDQLLLFSEISNTNNNIKTELKNMKASYLKLKQEKEITDKEIDDLKKILENRNKKGKIIPNNLIDTHNIESTLSSQINNFKSELLRTEKKNEEEHLLMIELRDKMNDDEEKVKHLNENISELVKENENKELEIIKLNQIISELNKKIEDIQNKENCKSVLVANKEDTIELQRNEIRKINGEMDELRKENKELSKILDQV